MADQEVKATAEQHKKALEKQLWNIANALRGNMSADEFRDYILGFIFYKYLSERMHQYADGILAGDGLKFDSIDESTDEGQEYLIAIKEESIDHLGYIWHTTGSGKTLTSFKTAQILTGLSEVHKVVFVVDRKDLDYQTSKEFNGFAKGCVDSTDNTNLLVNQFTDAPVAAGKVNEHRNTKLIVTTIQKLNNAISHKRYLSRMEKLKDRAIVFIFDECHRSQFGDTHQRIISFFNNHQMFGFTGTPIFVDNATSKASRKDIVATMEKAPSVLQRKKVIPRLTEKVKSFVSTFYGGM